MPDTTWLYIQSESSLWTVGFYGPSGQWQPESDHGSPDEAAARVHWLNGGTAPELIEQIRDGAA